MIKLILIFSFLSLFNYNRHKKETLILHEKSNQNDNINNTKDVYILPIDFESIIEDFDSSAIENMIGKLPRAPLTENEIIDDSFEGFLKREFLQIASTSKQINFETFYFWRQKAGIILTKEEVQEIYYSIIHNDKLCGLMDFITINKIIDEENNGHF